jgi:hypothetical protein
MRFLYLCYVDNKERFVAQTANYQKHYIVHHIGKLGHTVCLRS